MIGYTKLGVKMPHDNWLYNYLAF